jgi:predicted TIM-barrel fold metal-dependent hydrolase
MEKIKSKSPSAARRRKLLLGGILAVVFAWACLPARPFRPLEPIPAGIVDMHCHLAGIGAGGSGCWVSPRMRNNWRFNIFLRSFGVSQKEMMEQGDSLVADRISESLAQSKYVSKAVLLALDGVVGNDALARLDWAKAHGAVLVKWIPPVMEINPDDPKLIPFYKKMVELKLPLLSHTGEEKSFPRTAEELGDPEKLRLPLSLGVTVVAAHIASSEKYHGERGPDRLARLMREFPNLYTDISALTQVNKPGALKEALTRPEFAGRLLYGTDFPLINTALESPWYSFHLSLRQKFQIWRTKNSWDRDVLMKHDLGVPAETFARPGQWFQKSPA